MENMVGGGVGGDGGVKGGQRNSREIYKKDCLSLLEKVLLHGSDRCAHVLSSCGTEH